MNRRLNRRELLKRTAAAAGAAAGASLLGVPAVLAQLLAQLPAGHRRHRLHEPGLHQRQRAGPAGRADRGLLRRGR